jgi:hypothetical protein
VTPRRDRDWIAALVARLEIPPSRAADVERRMRMAAQENPDAPRKVLKGLAARFAADARRGVVL